MILLTVPLLLLLPQAVAAQRQAGPAIHLTLLMLGLCAATTVLAVMNMSSPPARTPGPAEYRFLLSLSPLALTVIGLMALVPAWWGIEQFRPQHDTRVDVVLAQTLALTLAAALGLDTTGLPHQLTGVVALGLLTALGLRAVQAIAQPDRKK